VVRCVTAGSHGAVTCVLDPELFGPTRCLLSSNDRKKTIYLEQRNRKAGWLPRIVSRMCFMIAFSESQLTTNNSATDNNPPRDRLTCLYNGFGQGENSSNTLRETRVTRNVTPRGGHDSKTWSGFVTQTDVDCRWYCGDNCAVANTHKTNST
jgi:hypothetical protein